MESELLELFVEVVEEAGLEGLDSGLSSFQALVGLLALDSGKGTVTGLGVTGLVDEGVVFVGVGDFSKLNYLIAGCEVGSL